MALNPVRCLTAYSAILTVGLVTVGIMAAAPRKATFDEIDVQRVNVKEPDGRVRLIISDRARFPGVIVRGRETPFDRQSAGMIFYNDEATENGGLIFSGSKDADGHISGVGHLSFDQYGQDQVVNLQQEEDGPARRAGLTISDRPEASIDLQAGLKLRRDPIELRRAVDSGAYGEPRAFFGKDAARASILALRDAKGRERLILSVAADGAAQIAFRDAAGRVTKTVTP